MKRLLSLSLVTISLAFTSCTDSGKIEDISWMIGQWQGTDVNDLVFHENWERDGKNSYTGSGSTVTPTGDTIFRETLKINLVEGTPYYVATVPENKGPVLFKMTKGDAITATFENMEHDFPQSISYTLENKNHMKVKLEGMEKGQPKVEHLEFERLSASPLNRIPDSVKKDTLPKEINIHL